MTTPAIPDGYTSVTPYLIVNDTCSAIDFYQKAFGAREVMRLDGPNQKIWHAEIQIGNARVMLADEFAEMNIHCPKTLGGSGVSLLVYVGDVDTVFSQALNAGATRIRAVEDQFYGDRSGMLRDPYGHIWSIATHQQDLSDDEIRQRSQAMLNQCKPKPG
jgi:PhnB protein